MPQTVVRAFRKPDKTVPIRDWLKDLEEREPKAFAKCLQRILLLASLGTELLNSRKLAAFLRDGVYELRIRVGNVHYRILYFFYAANAACLSHGLTKEGAVPDADIDLAVERRILVKRDPEKYTADWET